MALSDFFSNDFETSNKNKNPKLVTHHYRADYLKVRSEVLNVCERLGLEFVEEVEEYHEFRFIGRKQEMIIDIFSQAYFDQYVGIKVNTSYLISRGRGLKLITEFYALLDKALTKLD